MIKHIEEKLKYVLEQNPHTTSNNTEICIYFWEEIARRKEVNPNDWIEMKRIMRDYPPETITRARRHITKSNEPQKQKEQQFKTYFKPWYNS